MNTLFVGIDVSTKYNQVAAMDFDQKIYFYLSFRNNPDHSDMLFNSF